MDVSSIIALFARSWLSLLAGRAAGHKLSAQDQILILEVEQYFLESRSNIQRYPRGCNFVNVSTTGILLEGPQAD